MDGELIHRRNWLGEGYQPMAAPEIELRPQEIPQDPDSEGKVREIINTDGKAHHLQIKHIIWTFFKERKSWRLPSGKSRWFHARFENNDDKYDNRR